MARDLWTDAEVDWTAEPGLHLVQFLSRAFPDRPSILALLSGLGLDLGPATPAVPVDETWRRALTAAAARHLVLDVAGAALHAADAAFLPMLERLLGPAATQARARRLLRDGLPAEMCDRQHDGVDGPGLEAWDPSAAPPITQEEASHAEARAGRRVAAVEWAGHLVGTGCLVGPDVLLTAHHVVDGRDLQDVVAVFDHGAAKLTMGEEPMRVEVAEVLVSSPASQSERDRQHGAWDGIGLDTLDFTLLRLERAIGDDVPPGDGVPRGFYRMFEQRYELKGAPRLTVIHQAGGLRLLSSDTSAQFELNRHGSRFRYGATTLPGSSGGPIVDRRGRLVAIHTGAASTPAQGPRGQAVPIWHIAQLVRSRRPELLDPPKPPPQPPAEDPGALRLRLLQTLEIAQQPFVDREDLRLLVDRACGTDGSRRMLVVGEEDTGVSMSYTLLSHVAARLPSLAALKVDLRPYRNLDEPADRLRRVMEHIVGQLASEPCAGSRSDDVTWVDEQVRQHARDLVALQSYCSRRLRNAGRQWWIVFDSIDEVAQLGGGLDELIKLLLDLTKDLQLDLRVMLAGRAVSRLPTEFILGASTDTAVGLSREHSAAWLRAKANAEARPLDEGRLAERLDALFPPGSPPPSADLVQLRLPAILEEVVAT